MLTTAQNGFKICTSSLEIFLHGILTYPWSIRACATFEIKTSLDLDSDPQSGTFRVFAADCSCARDMSAMRNSLKTRAIIILAEATGKPSSE